MNKLLYLSTIIFLLFSACSSSTEEHAISTVDSNISTTDVSIKDPWSASNFSNISATHLELNLNVDFENKKLFGTAEWTINRNNPDSVFILDTDDLTIDSVKLDGIYPAKFTIGQPLAYIGRPLRISITDSTQKVTIYYATQYSDADTASALQWLEPEQTFGKKQPFLYTQNQPTMARSWIPCQDVPAVRFTYNATIQVPSDMLALMSAINPQKKNADGIYKFTMKQPIPTYLIALAVGDIAFKAEDEWTGVYAEPVILSKAHQEMTDLPRMIYEATKLYGPYQWDRYDVLILPKAFPIGGMENPMLTFCTPTILAGDKSLMNLVAHELAHSWSGNLVTNASWNDLWINEGFTVYFERRITEAMHGKDYVDMLWELGRQDLQYTLDKLGASHPETKLKLDIGTQDAANSLSDVAYEKGALFLWMIEKVVGRPVWDSFLNQYFNEYKFKPITTERFVDYLETNLLSKNKTWASQINYKAWIYQPGLPANAPKPDNKRFQAVEKAIKQFATDSNAQAIDTTNWSTYEWLHFLRNSTDITKEKMAILDNRFNMTNTSNSEIAAIWFVLSIKAGYDTAFPNMEKFLMETGRGKFLEPIYESMTRTQNGAIMANRIYTKSKKNYHPWTKSTIQRILRGN